MATDAITVTNAWQVLKRYTDARIGLGRAGISLPTEQHLRFQLDHARARDAVLRPLAWPGVVGPLRDTGLELLELHSCATDRNSYLQRPDWGRRLNEASCARLADWRAHHNQPIDIVVVVGDGLSASAIEAQAVPFMQQFLADLKHEAYSCDLLCCVSQCRVGLGDDVAERVNAKFLVMLIGERPGLSAADSLGIYFTYLARTGCSDADRNCLSNVRPKGLRFNDASQRLIWLLKEAERRQLSGVKLKDDSVGSTNLARAKQRNFLLPKP